MQEASRDKRARHRTSRHVSSRLLPTLFFSFFVVGLRSFDQLKNLDTNLRATWRFVTRLLFFSLVLLSVENELERFDTKSPVVTERQLALILPNSMFSSPSVL